MPTRKGYTQIEFPKELAIILMIESRRLGFHSVSEYVETLNKVRLKMAWSGLDLRILSEFGKLPEITTVSGRSEKEVMEKLGLQNAKKTFEETIPTPKGPEPIPEPPIKKQRKAKKKTENIEFFKGIEKPKGDN